jgi:hemolysin activation/secretion protein
MQSRTKRIHESMGMFLDAARRGSVVLTTAFLALLWSSGAGAAPDEGSKTKDEQRFDVQEYRVIGNTVLAGRDIERVLYPLLGPGKTLTDVESARKALETLYHDRGYGTVFVDIPPQTVSDGLVRLRVTEGRVEREQISGAHYFPEREVIASLPAAAPGGVLQLSKLQEELTTVNSATQDRSVVPVLKAGSAPGTVDLALNVTDTLPLHGSLELNNQETIDTKPLRAIASLSYGDLFGRLDSISLQYQTTPQQLDQVRVFAANYVSHPLESGLQPSFLYINSNSNVATVGTLGVLGIGEIYGLRLAYPFLTDATTLQSFTLGVDYKHFLNTINQNATTALNTPISYINLSAAYAGLWRSDWRTVTFSVAANFGPRGLVNNSEAFANDRYQGRANYFYLRGDLAVNFKLPADFTLRLRAAGQAAAEPLITNENFSIAGVDAVRGYLESEELGDKAIKETVQLTTPGWRVRQRVIGDAYVFFDAGRSWVIDPLEGEPAGASLRSYGAGFDILPGQKLTGSMTWTKTLTASSATAAGASRILFFLRGTF